MCPMQKGRAKTYLAPIKLYRVDNSYLDVADGNPSYINDLSTNEALLDCTGGNPPDLSTSKNIF
jgi:hypothetical protein